MAFPAALLTALLIGLAQPYPVPDTDMVYGNGLTFERPNGQVVTTYQQQGPDLILPSGAIVAWDAFVVFGALPLERTVEPGRYKVVLTVTQDDVQDKVVAFARVEFRPGAPVRWESAQIPGGAPGGPAYGVDSGFGAFMDAEVADFAQNNYDTYSDTLLQYVADVVDRDEYWTSLVVDEASGADAVAFTSGYGDGGYASFWGFDDNDDVVCLVTDFLVLNGSTPIQ